MTIDPRKPPYNADGTGATDATATLNAAIAAAVGITDIDISNGRFLLRGTLVINGQLAMHASNEYLSTFIVANPNSDAIHITTGAPVHLERFSIQPLSIGGQTAGTMIKSVIPTGQSNSESSFDRIRISKAYNGFDLTGCATWKMIDCQINDFVNKGVIIANPSRVDAGDSVIDRHLSLKYTAGGTHVWQASSGGLRLNNSKLLAGDYGYQLDLAAGASTGTLLINNNSLENQRLSGIYMDHETNSSFVMAVIGNNEFEMQNIPIQIASKDNTVWCRGVTMSGNNIYLAGTGGIAMQIDGAAIGTINGNNIYANGGTTYGIYLGQNTSDWTVGPQGMFNVTNQFVDLGSNNTRICICLNAGQLRYYRAP